MNFNKKIGARLKEARKKRGYTQEAIAEKFDLDKSSISKYENGVCSPDIEFLTDFAKFLKINGDWLLFGQPPVFKAEELNQDVEGLFLEFWSSIKGIGGQLSAHGLPDDVKNSLEGLAEESTDNLIPLFKYMAKEPTVRRDILKYFYIFLKPAIDEQREK
ncbi:MAG: helix-turn-helix transcriptional regulator [bacterium]|nr:helix-turn-helix transcriptional regulator [bacterium]